jgi:hypothetical protein
MCGDIPVVVRKHANPAVVSAQCPAAAASIVSTCNSHFAKKYAAAAQLLRRRVLICRTLYLSDFGKRDCRGHGVPIVL